jgi:hypothetical protein
MVLIFYIAWIYRSLIPVRRKGVFYLLKWKLPAFREEGEGRRSQHPVVKISRNGASLQQ